MKVIRRSCFETNSSSTHSFSFISEKMLKVKPSKKIPFGEFGWGYSELSSVNDKLSYLFTLIQYVDENISSIEYPSWSSEKDRDKHTKEVEIYEGEKFAKFISSEYYKWIREAVLEFSGVEVKINLNLGEYYPMGYIDHQSLRPCIFREEFSLQKEDFKKAITKIIFGDSKIFVDNDNRE